MKAALLLNERHQIAADRFVELHVWQVPENVRGSAHAYKYALAFVVQGVCILRYDNEAGKGDHRHIGDVQTPYAFVSPRQLIDDFWKDVDQWQAG